MRDQFPRIVAKPSLDLYSFQKIPWVNSKHEQLNVEGLEQLLLVRERRHPVLCAYNSKELIEFWKTV